MNEIDVLDLKVVLEGEGDHTVVMIHGWPDTLRLWDATVDHLKPHFRCARFTLPGYDKSHARQLYDLDAIIKRIDAVVDAVSPDKPVTLLIHDWGCLWGYQYYMRFPNRVARIIAVDIGDANSPEHMKALTLQGKLMGVFYQLYLALAWKISGSIGDVMTKQMARWMKAPGASDSLHSGMNYSYWWVWGSALKGKSIGVKRLKAECPFLFLYGKQKPAQFHSVEWAEQIQQRAGNRVEGFASGHWVMHDQPQQFNQVVLEWLQQQTQ